MMKLFFTSILLCAGCEEKVASDPSFPIEVVSCEKPWEMQEAELSVYVQDAQSWDRVGFVINQNENTWETNLAPSTLDTWEIQMRLIELNCVSDFNYEVHYFHGE